MSFQKTWAWILGIVLLLVGIIGFFQDPVLGIFGVNALHNVVHLITGLLFILAAWKGFSQPMNKWFGIIYLLIGIIGFFGVLSFLNVNTADNYLHILIGLVSALIGFFAK